MSPSEDKKGRKAPPPAKTKAKAKAVKPTAKKEAADKKAAKADKAKADAKASAKKAKPSADAAEPKAKTKAEVKAVPAKGKPAGKTAKAPKEKSKSVKELEAELDAGEDGAAPRKPKKVKPGSALVVVESPAKARTIGKYLGAGYVVKASVGHVRDLPKSKIGVDLEGNFEPSYEVIEGKKKVVAEIRKAARENEIVYLASDPDREGEAIAWHISEEIKDVNTNMKRVLINEITKKGVAAAIAAPRAIDMHKTDAQQARRILDRIVGYEISPILWNKVQRGLSAGRVQSVAVRLVCERDAEITAFKPDEYWSVEATCRGALPPSFDARIWRWHGEKAEPKTTDEAHAIAAELAAGDAVVATVDRKERRKKPQAPFITSKLQQDAARKLRFSAKRTMALAQRLYEGVELGDEGPTGLITYMRTDSTRVSDDAMTALREYITQTYGREYVPDEVNTYGNKERAQDAHEAIRPTLMEWTPERVATALAEHPEGPELVRLYTLIWQRFVASQMVPAVYDATTIDMERGAAVLRATGQVLKFAGYTKVYEVAETDDAKAEAAESADRLLPPIEIGEAIKLESIRPEQHFTQPPPRFSEASLVKELEERGIGRPSTYASIMSTIVDRGYVEKREARFFPTELGILVNGLLVESFPEIVNADFTAKMESDLDKVEEGSVDWRKLLGGFYTPFKDELEKARTEMRDVKREEIATEWVCEKCGKPMVIKWGRNGSFLACQGYPECRNTQEVVKNLDGTWEKVPPQTTDEVCETCGAPMTVKRGRFGSFLACTKYPECKTTKPISLGVKCPRPGCGGFIAEKRSRRGKPFYGCSNWAKKQCDFVAWDKPV
ncbi:MAG TPA: type I DNA topoisomerase, partial [Kofleriaceae bacterium]|nr:type I DNA topoisomerase [Kofleriaceae bacterium]